MISRRTNMAPARGFEHFNYFTNLKRQVCHRNPWTSASVDQWLIVQEILIVL